MRFLKKFNEAIIDWETDNIKDFYQDCIDKIKQNQRISFKEMQEIGEKK